MTKALNTKDIIGTILLHIPIGFFIVACLLVHWSLVLVSSAYFLAYEIVEFIKIGDKAYPEIAGSMIGIGIASAIMYLL